MAIEFKEVVRHDRLEFMPGVPLGFEDPDAEPYFIAAGWAATSKGKPVRTYTQEEVSIDPLTTIAETGAYVLPERAAEAKAATEQEG